MFNIIKGHINEVLKKEQDLYLYRINICQDCPLFTKTRIGSLCDKAKYITDENGNTIHGCGCRLDAKARLFDEKCVLNKW